MATVKEIAAVCGVSEQAIRGWCRRNHVAKDAKLSFAIDETTLLAIYQHYHVDTRNQVSQRAKPSFATRETSAKAISEPVIELLQQQLEVLNKQLEVKDEQIRDLSKALINAQEQGQAAQLLHAADRKDDLLLESSEQKQSRWERLKIAWRG